MRAFVLATVLTGCLASIGCGGGPARPARVPVHGTVTVDGQPIEGVTVYFEPSAPSEKQVPSSARIEAGGKFQLQTFGDKDGSTPGTFIVTLKPDMTTMKSPPVVQPVEIVVPSGGISSDKPVEVAFKAKKTANAAKAGAVVGPRP